jgi:hypothetical protein
MRQTDRGGGHLPRYLVQRTFPGGLAILANAAGAETFRRVVETNAELGVTWVHSYVTADKATTYCIYDGPEPDAIRRAAEQNGLPIDRITEVTVLDPHFYH